MTEKNNSSAYSLYRRLLGYAHQYKGHLTIGIIAGIVAGGSIFGLLQGIPGVLQLLDSPVVLEQTVSDGDVKYKGLGEGVVDENFVKAIKAAENHGIPVLKEDGSLTWQVMVLGLLALL